MTRSCPCCSVTCRRLDRRRHDAADRRHFTAWTGSTLRSGPAAALHSLDRRRHFAAGTGGGTSRPGPAAALHYLGRRRHFAAWTGGGARGLDQQRRSRPGPVAAHSGLDRRRHVAAWTGSGTSRPGQAAALAAWASCSSAAAAPWLWLLGPLAGFPYCGQP